MYSSKRTLGRSFLFALAIGLAVQQVAAASGPVDYAPPDQMQATATPAHTEVLASASYTLTAPDVDHQVIITPTHAAPTQPWPRTDRPAHRIARHTRTRPLGVGQGGALGFVVG